MLLSPINTLLSINLIVSILHHLVLENPTVPFCHVSNLLMNFKPCFHFSWVYLQYKSLWVCFTLASNFTQHGMKVLPCSASHISIQVGVAWEFTLTLCIPVKVPGAVSVNCFTFQHTLVFISISSSENKNLDMYLYI